MRKIALAVMLAAGLIDGSATLAEAETLQITLHLEGSKEIDIPITVEPGEFGGLDSSWGNVTFGGVLVGHYVFDREDKRHAGSQAPTQYPNPFYKVMIRTSGAPSQLLVLEGTVRPLAEGGGVFGGVTVATGPLAFLRGADFVTAVAGSGTVVVTFTY